MKRLLLAISLALSLGLVAAPASAQAPKETPKEAPAKAAKAKPAKAAETKLGPNQKLCRSKQPDGKIKTWTCGKDQPCCVNHSFNLYTCGSQLLQCF